MRLSCLLATLACLQTGQASEVVVGNIRVQALSPTLLRIEPKGPRGFEDRTTFTVVDREFAGVPIYRVNDSVLKTSHYTVLLGSSGAFSVQDPSGHVLYNSALDTDPAKNLLHWPSPLTTEAYALVDFPRFYAPPWDVAPIPKGVKVDPALLLTHGYDFRNNIEGDTYVFLLHTSLAQWHASRAEFLRLTGPVPLLPDFAYGTWFTHCYQYTEAEAKGNVSRWEADSLPLDVWALDMNWRLTANHTDRYYDYPNTDLFPNFTEWFAYLRMHRLRTYFNDHPFPVASRNAGGLQTSPEETAFRWQGLTKWMGLGLTYWWFDHNWPFSIPPPLVNTSVTNGEWHGLDNAAWGSHVYYTSVAHFDSLARDPSGDRFYDRPITLSKFAKPDWRAGDDPKGARESPSHHRYPVWWTGDSVDLKASVESMVDAGVHGLKPFVHSDCGSDDRQGSPGELLRWTAHCVFGTVLRFHGGDHSPWIFGSDVEATVREYLRARYKLLPTLIAAGQEATATGFPIVARCDLFWPEHAESATNGQYVFLRDVLVAPIWDLRSNMTNRSVWVPPGDWEDAWSGSVVTGPKTIIATQPYERQPMWYRRGGLIVLAHAEALRVDEQDWSSLSIEVFPGAGAAQRSIYERRSGERTNLTLEAAGRFLHLRISEGAPRSWVVRFHLRPGESAACARVDGQLALGLHVISSSGSDSALFGGPGSAPGPGAGPVVEVPVGVGLQARVAEVLLELESLLVV